MTVRRTTRWMATVIFLLLAICALLPGPVRGAEPRRQTIFAPQARYSVEITALDGNDYVNPFEVLEPLRKADARVDGKSFKLMLAGTPPVELHFRDRKRKFSLSGGTLELAGDFRLVGGAGYIPLASLDWLLTKITGLPSEMHSSTHRLFLGGVATRISAEVRKSPSRLVLSFPFAVNPEIASEGNNLKLIFSREPVVSSGAENLNFGDTVLQSATTTETTRGVEFVVHGTAPLSVGLADSGKTIVISGPQVAVAPSQAPTQVPAVAQQPVVKPPQTQSPTPIQPERKSFVVAVDAAHGGGETGVKFSDTVLEKDVTLGIARRLVHELQSRGIGAMLVRSGDNQITPEQRAIAANTAAPTRAYIAIHAAASGNGLRIYRAMIPQSQAAGRASFVPWQAAQAPWLEKSTALATAIATECTGRQFTTRSSAVPLATLSSIAGPAVAIEVAPASGKVSDLGSAEFQQNIASLLANAIVAAQTSTAKQGGAQ